MRRLIVIELLSLDGVMQAPAGPDEDTEGGFRHGGWSREYFDETSAAAAAEGIAGTDAYLFGRKTYENMAAYWPTAPPDDPFAKSLNNTTKYVASRTLKKLEWRNSILIEGDVAKAVAELKDRPGGNIAVLGSGDLVQTLIEGDLVDAYSLTVNPIALGEGKRLFRNPEQSTRLKLVDSQTTSKGSLLLTYEPE